MFEVGHAAGLHDFLGHALGGVGVEGGELVEEEGVEEEGLVQLLGLVGLLGEKVGWSKSSEARSRPVVAATMSSLRGLARAGSSCE